MTHFVGREKSNRAKSNRIFPLSFALFLFCSLALGATRVYAWGAEGHYWITARAIECLEGRLKELYSKRSALLIKHSVDADYRKEKDPEEGFRHYIDLDRYGVFPFRRFSLDYESLVAKLGKERVQKNGVVLWAAQKTFNNLVDALRSKDREKLLRHSSDLSHYVGDLHQPFHTARNHNGQFTGQHGIHFRFELDLLNLYLKKIPFVPARASDLGSVLEALYAMALDSFVWVDNILVADQKVVSRLGIDRRKFATDRSKRKLYPDPYYSSMFGEVGPIIERQLNHSAHFVASLWWMAYQEAGKPVF